MKKILILSLIFAMVLGIYVWKTDLEENYGDYLITFEESGDISYDLKMEIFVHIFDMHYSEFGTDKVGNDFSDIDSTLTSDLETKMKEGVKFSLTFPAVDEKRVTTKFIYNDGYLFQIKGDFDNITKESYVKHILFTGKDRLVLEYIVFLNQ